MAFIPELETVFVDEFLTAEETETVEELPSKTFAIDFENGTIGGLIDGESALRQFVLKALLTERSKYVIYSDDYGNELRELVGSDVTPLLLESEVPRMVREALVYDDRIDDVINIICERDGDKLYVSFTVVPTDSDEELTEEVELNV